jgi:antitoxin component YwqK of YwqJK toxin-antitoxin module
MGFMARQVRSAIKYFVVVYVFSSCQQPQVALPLLSLNAAAHAEDFLQNNGKFYFRGKPYTGVVYTLFSNGDTAMIMPYENGKENGLVHKYYAKNKIAEERLYEMGGKAGVHRGWFPNGRLQFEYHFKNDEYEGEATEWYETGVKYRRFNYLQGHEDGRQQMWWPDGSVRANYVVKDGEQFGLIGRKLCINPYHEKN